ncbi:C2 calcium/lipid-binding plant phosphoribosyltransferase family protein [Perilla frutescens var. hirtella]|uniref:C2 calcium/lipid-binding plant phosphoribosyltransferase family protein n=1 Tax=Perilla frutescens var. hirtella TaxID=608512 RepID=A0AAD4IP48_PERFH|nr:C2 calcium/lipid-binding plant phosphoribosyltransferase family protein [Perilla frutescens var. hirtella]
MKNLKLAVDVVRAHNLLPKDGQGSSNAAVELFFDGQKFRTTIKSKDLNPYWKETFYFNVSNPLDLHNLTLEAQVYSINTTTNKKSSLGKVRINGTSFVPYSDAVVFNYPLERNNLFSSSRGELALKVYLTGDASASVNLPQPSSSSSYSSLHSIPDESPSYTASVSGRSPNGKSRSRRTFYTLSGSDNQQQRPSSFTMPSHQTAQYGAGEMRFEPQATRMYQGSSSQSQHADFTLRETNPVLGGRSERPSRVHDLVEPMQFLFVRVVKARDLPPKDITGSLDPYVEVKLGNYKGVTRHFEKTQNPEWNTVFTFSKDRMQSYVLEVVVMDKDLIRDDFAGTVRFDLHEIPRRVPPDSPLAPEWYRLEDKKGEKKHGEIMLAVWIGTQADEAFADAWHSDAASPVDSSVPSTHIRSKVYHSPRLWYVRVNVIEAQDLVMPDRNRFPNVHVKAQIGNQVLKTKYVQSQTMNALWNEDLMFVAAEPFDDQLIVSVEDHVGPNKDETVGKVSVPLTTVERRADDRVVHSRWFHLQKPSASDVEGPKRDQFSSRIHLRICLDGGYHVLDESTQYSSDLRPAAKQLWKPAIGVLELGILNADALTPMKTRNGRGTSDTYCVAKYGQKWIRTRTITDSLNPKFNEQYTWEVFDPATVVTVGVFDNGYFSERGGNANGNGNRDMKIGKVRIRISTLETGRVYTHSYPLIVLHPSGVKKMGELHLAIRFSCTSMVNMMSLYSRPLLPKMHYIRPLSVVQLDMLRYQAVNILATRLSRSEPPLRKEVIEYMTDANSHMWSMRRSKANFYRLMAVFNGVFAVSKWLNDVCLWKNPITTVLVYILFIMLVFFPELILPTMFLYMFLIGAWNYRFRPRNPPHMNTRLSCADTAMSDELDEEFDAFPTARSPDTVRARYDRLRSVASRIQRVVGDIASQGERIQALLSWRDPRATLIFMIFCIAAAIVFYAVPLQLLTAIAGSYIMRHPRFRHKLPPAPLNFFRRLPARTDSML